MGGDDALNQERTIRSHSLAEASWDSKSTGSSLLSDVLSELSGISLVSITSGLTSNPDDSSVDGTRDAVLLLHINLWQLEVGVLISVVFLDISLG